MSFGIGFVLGPAIGGFLAEIDPRLPFWASAAASLANALFGWWWADPVAALAMIYFLVKEGMEAIEEGREGVGRADQVRGLSGHAAGRHAALARHLNAPMHVIQLAN